MPNHLLCLATRKGLEVLRAAAAQVDPRTLIVCTFREVNVAESFDEPIRQTAAAAGIPTVDWPQFRDDPIGFMRKRDIGSALCVGWRYLFPPEAVEHLKGNVVVAHDSLLPKLRGFAPLPTALILGEPRTGVTFLRVGNATDDGPILWQSAFDIGPADTIGDLIERTLPIYVAGALRHLRGEFGLGAPQDESQATYSIWRDDEDYQIDWAWDAPRIERSVRALGPPYLGARTTLGDATLLVRKAEIVPDVTFAIRQPGKIWSLDRFGRPTVVCGAGLLKLVQLEKDGSSALPIRALRQRFR